MYPWHKLSDMHGPHSTYSVVHTCMIGLDLPPVDIVTSLSWARQSMW